MKFQTNLEIAGSLRNSFRASLAKRMLEVELLVGREGFTAYQIRINSECWNTKSWSEPAGAKVRGREGKNPDHRLRSRMDS